MSITDLHICKESITSKSESQISSCDCGPEYYCSYICPEDGYSLSTLISWQHFPRSTSSRSRCDDSEEIIIRSISEESKSSTKREESSKPSSTEYPITKSFSQLRALHYLEIRHVFEYLNFLISHLVSNEPEDPVEFLINLVEKCIKFRDSFGEPPLLFTHAHIQSLYNAFDPFERGHLTLDQYMEAMRTLGLENSITPYNKEPSLNEDGCVEQTNFMFEAERCLVENLRQMLRIPKIWEENRLLWKVKMEKIKAKKALKEENESVKNEEKLNYCRCSVNVTPYCMCSAKQKSINEPEQLFLN